MKKIIFAVALFVATFVTLTPGQADTSAPIRIATSPSQNRHWTTVFTNEIPIRWQWAPAADSVELKIDGMSGMSVMSFAQGTSEYVWRVFNGNTPKQEEVYDLTVTFKNSQAEVVEVLTAKIAVLAGAFGSARIDPGSSDRLWLKVTQNVVIPYDARWRSETWGATAAELEIAKQGGDTQSYSFADGAGYFGWQLQRSNWGFGAFDLTLAFPGIEDPWQASLNYMPSATVMIIR